MLCFLPCTRLALGSASAETVKGASSLYSLMRNLGGTVGLAALGTIITDRVALHWTRLAETLSLPHLTVTGVLDRSFDPARGFDAVDAATPDLAVIAQQVMTQAMIMTFDDCFLIMACLFAGAMPLVVVVRTVSTTSRAQHGTVKSLGAMSSK
jgi:DHA2 family multidrug resistance protein